MRIRCGHGGVIGLLTNRNYRRLAWVKEAGFRQAADLFEKDGDARMLLDLSPADARKVLAPAIPKIIKSQRSSGLWRIKNAREISFHLLTALAHAGLLKKTLPQLRHDPLNNFREAGDWQAVAVREQLLNNPRPDEKQVKNRLLKDISDRQASDGSWENTVMGTVQHLEMLLECGLSGSREFTRGVNFLFQCIQPEFYREEILVAHDMITSANRMAEYKSTKAHHPDWLPHPACHCHLPMIQTGFALRMLNKAGYEDDSRVMAACRNMVELRERFGGWCVTNIRLGLEAEAKKQKKAKK
jgi:hypothetical protein